MCSILYAIAITLRQAGSDIEKCANTQGIAYLPHLSCEMSCCIQHEMAELAMAMTDVRACTELGNTPLKT